MRNQLFGERAVTALGKDGLLGMKLNTWFKHFRFIAVLINAHIVCGDTHDRVIGIKKNFTGGKACKYLNA